jgi:hypothetical protein
MDAIEQHALLVTPRGGALLGLYSTPVVHIAESVLNRSELRAQVRDLEHAMKIFSVESFSGTCHEDVR